MKWLIASDLHGSVTVARQLLEAYDKEEADRLLFLGDILYHGPRNELPEGYDPKGVIALLNERKEEFFCVRGNCDTEVDQMVLQFPILAEYALLPMGKRTIYATHGHIRNQENLPPLKAGDILLHGHTHVPQWKETETCLILNPGSVTIPKEDSPRSYMLWEGNTFLWKTLDGTVYHELTVE